MKRANGEGTIKKRKNGTWEAQVTIGKDDNGKPIRKSVYGKTQKEVAQKLTAMTNDLNNGLFISPDDITVGQWFDIFISDYNKGVKASTLAQYEYQVRQNIKPTIGNIQLQKLTAPMIQRLYNDKLETLSPKSIRNLHGFMHKGLNQAVMCQYLKVNPCLACQLPRVEKKEMKTLTSNALELFLHEIRGKVYEDLFFIAIFTGMRQAELLGLTWSCVDFEKGQIDVKSQLKRERKLTRENEYRFDSLKNGKSRVIVPAPIVFDVLRKVKRTQSENHLKYGCKYENKDDLVFTDVNGSHLCHPSVWRAFKRRVAAIGYPDLRFHDLRHSFATISIENGDDIKTVSENLGHATVAFTLDVYGHVTDKMKKQSADRMQDYIKSICP